MKPYSALRTALNDIVVRETMELAAMNRIYRAVFCKELNIRSSGDHISIPIMNMRPETTVKNVVLSAVVLKMLLLSFP
jgi:hypothetical protein